MATRSGEGAVRAALAALCTNGGFEASLRMPGLAVSGADAEQLGLGTPQFQDLPIGPAVWRRMGKVDSLLVGAGCVAVLMGSQEAASAETLFQSAVGVAVGGVLYPITRSEALLVAGKPCAYRLSVQAPTWA